ncbi:serine protease ami-like [Triplophysa dalaica]|uniref:serine protease ami-like n=1 Tax=Triplophysa dalaica TaxID=1582913 RepID=UPI0024E0410E|nr:serine protease ami-like [Triplophysa dalaica]
MGISLLSASVNVGIVNGTEAQPHSRPYMVSIQENGVHVCGGFLISDESVLTAAHCREKNEILTVVAGVQDFSSTKEKPVKIEVMSYNKHQNKADLMILKEDSGGPLVCDNTAVGVTSFGDKICNNPNRSNVYIDISQFAQWINHTKS